MTAPRGLIPHTIGGKTHLIPDPNPAPAAPRDVDRAVLTAVTAGAAVLVTVSVIWSTASIGDLLARVTVAPAAYGAAVVFDLAWIMCMAVEWLCRYEPKRAKLARWTGHAALLVAMVAVAAHGHLAGQLAIGIVGATVSGIAKGGWSMVMRAHARPLDERTLAWLHAEASEVDGALALIPVQRRLTRGRAQLDAERTALRIDPDTNPDDPDQSADDPDAEILDLAALAATTKDAVRIAWDSGLRDKNAIVRCVGKATGRAVSPDTVERYLRALRVGA